MKFFIRLGSYIAMILAGGIIVGVAIVFSVGAIGYWWSGGITTQITTLPNILPTASIPAIFPPSTQVSISPTITVTSSTITPTQTIVPTTFTSTDMVATPSSTPAITNTSTTYPSATSTATITPTPTIYSTATQFPATFTLIPLPTNTFTPIPTAIFTPIPSPTNTFTPIPTATPTKTQIPPTITLTNTNTPTTDPPTNTPIPPTQTSTKGSETAAVPSPTATPSETIEPTATQITPSPTVESCNYSNQGGWENQLLEIINQFRRDNGVPVLGMQSQLRNAAREHSMDMACNDFVSHIGSNGSTSYQRVVSYGYYPSRWGENIYMGWNTTPENAFNWWINSTPHLENLLNPYYQQIGIGHAQFETSSAFTLNFATP